MHVCVLKPLVGLSAARGVPHLVATDLVWGGRARVYLAAVIGVDLFFAGVPHARVVGFVCIELLSVGALGQGRALGADHGARVAVDAWVALKRRVLAAGVKWPQLPQFLRLFHHLVKRVDKGLFFAATTLGFGRAHASFGCVMVNSFEERAKCEGVCRRGGLVHRLQLDLAGVAHGGAYGGLRRGAGRAEEEEQDPEQHREIRDLDRGNYLI